jgi:hypothetical protein
MSVDLRYQTDQTLERCPTEAEFRAMINAQLGYDPFAAPSEHTVFARTQATEAGMSGVVEWYDTSGALRGRREMQAEGRDCQRFMKAMSFAIAVQIQLLAAERESSGSTPADASEGEPSPLESPATKRPEPIAKVSTTPKSDDDGGRRSDASRRDIREWQFMAGAGPALVFGLAPRAVFEGRIFTTARYRAAGLELAASASPPSRHTIEEDEGFERWTVGGSLAGCSFFGAIAACLVNKLDWLSVRGFGVDEPRSDSGLFPQLGLRLAVGHLLDGKYLGAVRIEALAALRSWDVTLSQRTVWDTPSLTLTMGADLAAVFQ